MEEIKQALDLKVQLDALRPIDKEQENRIMQKFRLDWNYHSNHLEGNSLTYGETKALILFGITAQGKPLKDTLEITGHNEAINWVIDMVKGERPLTENFIRELHTLLLKESYEVDAITPEGKPTKKRIAVGSYKTTANHVKTKTGEIFYFSTPEETQAEMTALLDWYTEKSKEVDVNPIFLAAEFHYKFIRIHPFDDGNGRTARILMNFILMQFGFPPTIIKSDKDSKDEYFAALQLADTGNIEAFITFIAQNLVRSLEIMIAGAKGEDIEEPDDLDKEIALLEQRLSGIGEKSNIGKSNESLNDLLDNVLYRLYSKIIEKSGKLNDMYLYNNLLFSPVTGDDYQEEDFTIDELKSTSLLYKADEIIMEISFNEFTTIGFDEFSYQIFFNITLTNTSYSISDFDGNLLIQKPYGKYLSDAEMNKIVKTEVKGHKEFIEQKIAEKENKP